MILANYTMYTVSISQKDNVIALSKNQYKDDYEKKNNMSKAIDNSLDNQNQYRVM